MHKKTAILFAIIFSLLSVCIYANDTEQSDTEQSMEYLIQGELAFQRNEVEKGFSLIRKAIELDSDNYAAITSLAGAYARFARDLPKSVELFQKAIEINEDFDMAHFGLALSYADMGMKEEAKKEIEKAMTLTDKDSVKNTCKDMIRRLELEK